MGELGLTITQFGEYTVGQIEAIAAGYVRRHDAQEDLLIAYCALPTYQTQMGKRAPTFRKLTAHRQKRQRVVKRIEETELEKWRLIFEKEENHAQINGDQTELVGHSGAD